MGVLEVFSRVFRPFLINFSLDFRFESQERQNRLSTQPPNEVSSHVPSRRSETACWTSVLIRVLIWREFGVLYNCQYVCTLLHNLGFSFQKARLVSDHLDAARRQHWLQQAWPRMLRAAQRQKGLVLFEDEASFAQWGSLSSTWARRGQQPEVKTSGKRKGYKVFGAIEYFSGRLLYQGIEGRFNSESYQGFLQSIMAQTTQPLFLIHDGARYHTSAAPQAFLAAHRDRITVEPLPLYSPDYNPIEYL